MIDIQMDGIYLDNGCLVKEAGIQPDDARENTIAYQILRAHSTSEEPDRMQIKFDALISQDLTYVGIIQTARSSGMTEFPMPYAMTNCHNSKKVWRKLCSGQPGCHARICERGTVCVRRHDTWI